MRVSLRITLAVLERDEDVMIGHVPKPSITPLKPLPHRTVISASDEEGAKAVNVTPQVFSYNSYCGEQTKYREIKKKS